jgi:predicted anti-sigma-YlaC factor YlaD
VATPSDWDGMDCLQARELASAGLDGQLTDAEERSLDAHLAGCGACADWIDAVADMTRRNRVGHPGVTAPSPAAPPRGARNRAVRFALAWAGILLVAWHLPEVITAGNELAVHLARQQAGFAVALGIGFIFVAWRPDRAYGVLPMVAAFTVVLTIVAVIDLANGTSNIAVESRHLLEIGGLALMWVLGSEMGPTRSVRGMPGPRFNDSRRQRHG